MFTDSFGKLSEIFKFSKKEFFYEIRIGICTCISIQQ